MTTTTTQPALQFSGMPRKPAKRNRPTEPQKCARPKCRNRVNIPPQPIPGTKIYCCPKCATIDES